MLTQFTDAYMRRQGFSFVVFCCGLVSLNITPIPRCSLIKHYSDVIMGAMASQITSLIRRRSKKTSKLRVTGLFEGNSTVTGDLPVQRASNVEMFPFDDVIMITRNPGGILINTGAIWEFTGGLGHEKIDHMNPMELIITWWRHQMETFSAFLALCAGNSPVIGEFPSQRPVTRNSDVFFDLRLQ